MEEAGINIADWRNDPSSDLHQSSTAMSKLLPLKALPFLAFVLLASGCATYPHGDIFRNPSRVPHRNQVERDVNTYVRSVDRAIGLSRRDEREITRLLHDRTYRLLDRTRSGDRRYVYPFPRRSERSMNSAQYSFWRDADRAIERRLPRSKARRYAALTDQRVDRRYGRDQRYGSDDRRDRDRRDRRDRRYDRDDRDDRYERDRRYDRDRRWDRDDDDDDDDDDGRS